MLGDPVVDTCDFTSSPGDSVRAVRGTDPHNTTKTSTGPLKGVNAPWRLVPILCKAASLIKDPLLPSGRAASPVLVPRNMAIQVASHIRKPVARWALPLE
jgi:hypothetical protein